MNFCAAESVSQRLQKAILEALPKCYAGDVTLNFLGVKMDLFRLLKP